MLISKNDSRRKFTNSFLLIVLAIVFVSFIALWIYQSINKEDVDNQSGTDNQSLVNDLQAANQVAIKNAAVELQEVPPIQATDHVLGQVSAPVQLIIYSDFTDPLAAGFLPIVQELKKQVGESVVIAWRQHPLANNPLAAEAAIAIECASQQGHFWDFATQVASSSSQEKLLADWSVIAQTIGLKSGDFERCLTKPEVQATIDKQSAEAEALGAIGVPSSFLNKTLLSGVYPLADFTGDDGQIKAGLLKLVRQAAGETVE